MKSNPPRPLPKEFWLQDTLSLAQNLLGKVLIRDLEDGTRRIVRLVETEAYCGPEDLCAHTARGRLTPRNRAMHGPAGYAYIYRIYGIHLCLNIVSEEAETPHAILLRAAEPFGSPEGWDETSPKKPRPPIQICQGPGLLCRSLKITMDLYGTDMRHPGPLWVGELPQIAPLAAIGSSPRIGVTGGTPWVELPWRFYVKSHPAVSGPAKWRR